MLFPKGVEVDAAVQAIVDLGLENVVVHEVEATDAVRLTEIEVYGVAHGDFDLCVTIDGHLGNSTWLLRECVPSERATADCRHVVIDNLGNHEVEMFAIGHDGGRAWVAYASAFAIADAPELARETLDLLGELVSALRSYGVPTEAWPLGAVDELFGRAIHAAGYARTQPRLTPHPLSQEQRRTQRLVALSSVA